MATTKAFELAQLSALTTVGADTSLADSLNLNAATHSFQISGTPVLSYSGGNVIVGDLGAGVGLEFNGSTHLITDAQGVNVTGELDVSGILDVAGVTTSTSTSTGALVVAGGAGIAENLNVGGNAGVTGNLTVTGDLTVEGSQVSLNTTALDVEDKNITLNYHASNDTSASADGAGITIQDAVNGTTDASILWGATYDEFSISHPIVVSNAIYSNGSSPRVQLQDTDGTNQFSFFQQSTSQLSLRLRNDASDGSFLVAGYGGSTTTNRFLIGSTGNITFYDTAGDPGMVWDASEGSDGALLIGGHTDLRSGSVAGRNDAQLSLESTNYHNATFIANQNTTNGYHLIIGKSRGTDVGDVDIVQALDEIGSLTFAAADGTDLRPKVAQISAYVPSGTTPGVNTVSGELRFGTTNQGQDVTNHMVLDKDGKVGIGTESPSYPLEVEGTATTNTDIVGFSNSNGTAKHIFGLENVGAGTYKLLDQSNNTAVFFSGHSADNSYINAGNVGIGTDSPNATLVVSTNGAQGIEFFPTAASGVTTTQYYNRSGAAYVRNRNIALDHTFNLSGASEDALTIATTGKVGIGISSPDHSLDVNGAIATRQARHNIRPTLNFDFANSKELDSRFTFYRATKASYVDADGIIKFVNQNVPRFDHNPATGKSLGLLLEEDRTNEILDSINLYSSWVETSCAIQRNYAVAPDSTWSAIRIQPDGTNNSSFAQQTASVVYSSTYTISAYVKSDGADYAFLCFANTGFNGRATVIVRLSDGVITFSSGTSESSITTFSEEYKNGWWRIGLTVTADSANGAAGSYEIGPSSEATPTSGTNANPVSGTDNTKAILVWGPQRELGTNASTYIPTRTNFESRASRGSYINEDGYLEMAPSYEERFTYGYDGTKLIEAGPIIEPARTNLHENSEWNLPSNPTIVGSVVASGRSKTDYQTENTTAPDGSLWPIMITNAVSGGNYYYQNYSLTLNTNYTFSIFFRLPNNNTENINSFTVYAHNNSFPTYYYVTYDFTTDAITQSTAGSFYTIQKYPNNWRRISITVAPDASSGFDFLYHFNASGSTTAQSYSGGAVAGLPIGYVFGPQLELGNQPTTYIPTGRRNTGATVARAADVATFYNGVRLDDLCDIYETDEINSERGTVYTEWSSKVPTSDGVGGVFEMWDSNAGGTNGIDQRLNSFYVTNNYGVSTGNYLGPEVVHKTSLGYDRDNLLDWRTTTNGTHTGTNSVHKFSMNLTRLSLGRIDLNPAYMLNGHLKRFVLYNSQLSLEEQKALTENN